MACRLLATLQQIAPLVRGCIAIAMGARSEGSSGATPLVRQSSMDRDRVSDPSRDGEVARVLPSWML